MLWLGQSEFTSRENGSSLSQINLIQSGAYSAKILREKSSQEYFSRTSNQEIKSLGAISCLEITFVVLRVVVEFLDMKNK